VVILVDLRPVGGVQASFRGAEALGAAIELLLTDEKARESLRSLTTSAAESGINSSGFATLAFQDGDEPRQASFVSKMAVSSLQPGAEQRFDKDQFYSPVSKALVFSRTFFDKIARKVSQSVSIPTEPESDGSEYDAEEARQARYSRLGVLPGSRFLNIGVDTQVTWPRQEMCVQFDKHHLVLMPKTNETSQSVHIDLATNRLTDKQALTIINRFLSVLAWCDDQFAVVQGGWSGNPVPVPVSKRNLAFATANEWPFDRRISESDEVRRALAIYREGLNAEEAGLGSYAVLSYFKILEIRYEGQGIATWIGNNLAAAIPSSDDVQFEQFRTDCGTDLPADYLYKACRIAVAHVSDKYPSDTDDAVEGTRLYTAAHVLRALARRLIAGELGVSEEIYAGD
jgi:hypothetical protein